MDALHIYVEEQSCHFFDPDLIWNDEALGFFQKVAPTSLNKEMNNDNNNNNNNNKKKMSRMWDQFLIQKGPYALLAFMVVGPSIAIDQTVVESSELLPGGPNKSAV